jgi:SAM-dependent methyltransferase
MPLTDDFRLPEDYGDEFLYDIDVYLCESCRTSQILHDIDYSGYYRDYAFTVAGSPFALRCMSRLAQAAFGTYHLKKGCSVVEVGSGDGTQLSFFRSLGARVFGFEPSHSLCRASEAIGVPVHQGLFDEHSAGNLPQEFVPVDLLLLTYTFDHIPEPARFLDTARRILDPEGGLLVIEVHDLEKIFQRREYCLFEHEHSIYLSALTMQRLLDRCGFSLISTDLVPESERRGNSLLVAAALHGSRHARYAVSPLRNPDMEAWQTYESFAGEIHTAVRRLNGFVETHAAVHRKVAGYGAGGRGVMTLAAMHAPGKIQYLCDRNPAFYGRVTPKSHVRVVPPETLQDEPVDVLLVFSFGYIAEIREHLSRMSRAPRDIVSLLDVL